MGKIRDFIREAQRRRAFRVAAIYVIALWVLLQVADVLFPALGIAESVKLYVVLGGFICFPLAVVFGWRYDLTARGIVRTSPADPEPDIHQRLSPVDYLTLASLAAVVLIVAIALGGEAIRSQKAVVNLSAPAAADKSVAILPFRNLSDSDDDLYFADGVTEEIHNALAQIDGIRLVGRSSSSRFRDSDADLRSIGVQLNVANILEGSVRRSGDTLRITAQLIDAANGFSLWSKVYERQVADVFRIQDEIARNIGSQLDLRLDTNDARESANQTENLSAYNLFLRANHLASSGTPTGREDSLELYLQAIDLDPEFAPPYFRYVWECVAVWGRRVSDECRNLAEPFLFRVQQLTPGSVEVDVGYAFLHEFRDLDFVSSRMRLEQALERHPRDPTVLRNLAYNLLYQWGDPGGALELLDRFMEVEPLAIAPQLNAAYAYLKLDRPAEAEQLIRAVMQLEPGSPWGYEALAALRFESDQDYVEGFRLAYESISLGELPFRLADASLELEDVDRASHWAQLMIQQDQESYVGLLSEFKVRFVAGTDDALDIARQLATVRVSPIDLEWNDLSNLAWLRLLQDVDATAATAAYARNYPALFRNPVVIGDWNHAAALGLAKLHMNQDNTASAESLVDAVADYLARSPVDHSYAKAAVEVLRNDHEAALRTIERSVDRGRRFGWWVLERDTLFESLWPRQSFVDLIARMRTDMRQRLIALELMEQSGQLERPPAGNVTR